MIAEPVADSPPVCLSVQGDLETEADGDTIFKLAALALQAAHGDYVE